MPVGIGLGGSEYSTELVPLAVEGLIRSQKAGFQGKEARPSGILLPVIPLCLSEIEGRRIGVRGNEIERGEVQVQGEERLPDSRRINKFGIVEMRLERTGL